MSFNFQMFHFNNKVYCFQLQEKGSKTIIPRALQNGLLFYNCLGAFDHYAKPNDSTSAASHFPSLYHQVTWLFQIFYFFIWTFEKNWPAGSKKHKIKLEWPKNRTLSYSATVCDVANSILVFYIVHLVRNSLSRVALFCTCCINNEGLCTPSVPTFTVVLAINEQNHTH